MYDCHTYFNKGKKFDKIPFINNTKLSRFKLHLV